MILSFKMSEWSNLLREQWALVALGLIFVALLGRHLLLLPCWRALKSMSKDVYKETLRLYSTRSLIGWILMAGAFGIAESVISLKGYWPSVITRREGICLALIFYLLGIILHVRSIHLATVSVCKGISDLDRGF